MGRVAADAVNGQDGSAHEQNKETLYQPDLICLHCATIEPVTGGRYGVFTPYDDLPVSSRSPGVSVREWLVCRAHGAPGECCWI